jgi:putative hydrolase of the HAD superfamily
MKRFEHIQAVTFDAGGTLIEPWPSVGHVYAKVAAECGVEGVPPEALNQQFKAAWRKFRNFNHSREEWAMLVDQTFAGFVQEPPSRTFFPELYACFARARAWRVFEDVLPALNALAALDLRLGVVSNWDDRLGPLLEQLGLSRFFEAIVISCDVGFAKPSPVIFEHTAKKLGVPENLILHVGDSVETDLAGARAAGCEAVLVERGRLGDGAGRIGSLGDLEGMFHL